VPLADTPFIQSRQLQQRLKQFRFQALQFLIILLWLAVVVVAPTLLLVVAVLVDLEQPLEYP
jgi:hypothetical protein